MANTRITQGVIKPNEDYDVRHINATGVITATNLSLSGVLTYEDVTNVDSIGIITCLLYTSPSPRDATLSRMPSSA